MSTPDVVDVMARWRNMRRTGEGTSKVLSLREAVRRYVRPGDLLYFGGSMARPNAAMFEVARAFWTQRPGFTLAAPAIANQHAPLIRAGLVKKVITSIHAMTFPTPAPHPLYVEADRAGAVQFENWSLLTLVLRLFAASMGLPFMPTRSLAGSDMAKTLAADAQLAFVQDPFGSGEIAAVPALVPDVTFVHALAADSEGNALFCPPHYDDKWAAMAAGRAVIVSVERVVDGEFIRRRPDHVRLPASTVTAVCEAPLGGHPNSVPGDLVPEIGGYPDDYAFLDELCVAGKSGEALDRWSERWITGCRDHWQYLERLGVDHVHALRGRSRGDGWIFDLPAFGAARSGTPASEAERHVALATRMLVRRLQSGEIDSVLAGLGVSSLAAWMASIRALELGRNVPLMVEGGMVGYLPAPADPFLFNYRNMFNSSMLSDVLTVLGVLTAGPRNRAIGVLGAAQIDQEGNLNTTRLPNLMLTGSGGGNDIASGASEVLVTIGHARNRLVPAVDFVTSPGRAVMTIVTPMAVIERDAVGFRLTRVLARADRSLANLVDEARGNCGWNLRIADRVELEPEPSPDEIELCRLLDPQGRFLA